jgi:hypothetical protein
MGSGREANRILCTFVGVRRRQQFDGSPTLYRLKLNTGMTHLVSVLTYFRRPSSMGGYVYIVRHSN